MQQTSGKLKPVWYFLLSVALWFIIDFGTAGGFRISYYEKIWPTILLFYLGFPLIFSVLIFRLQWTKYQLFLSTLATIYIIEVVFTRNPLLMTFPTLLWGIPLAVLVYVPLVYFPLWVIRGEIEKHGLIIVVLCMVEVAVMLLTIFG